MSFLFYFAVLVAALVSVFMGVNLASQPPSKPAIQAVSVEPIRHAPTLPPVAAQEPVAPAIVPPKSPPQQTVSQSSEEPSGPPCNVQACSAAYQSFRALDCTYQPFDGPRRICTK